jgi:hypothetical protein
MQRRWERLVSCLGVVVIVGMLAACGVDDDNNNGGNGNLSVRQGTWNTTTTTTFSGPGGCQMSPKTETSTEVVCDLEDELTDPEVDCDIDVDGNSIDIDCTTTINFDPCVITVHASGGGTFGETSYDVTLSIFTTVTGGGNCSEFADPCTTTVRVVGEWASSAGNCDEEAPGIPVRSLLARRLGGAVLSR